MQSLMEYLFHNIGLGIHPVHHTPFDRAMNVVVDDTFTILLAEVKKKRMFAESMVALLQDYMRALRLNFNSHTHEQDIILLEDVFEHKESLAIIRRLSLHLHDSHNDNEYIRQIKYYWMVRRKPEQEASYLKDGKRNLMAMPADDWISMQIPDKDCRCYMCTRDGWHRGREGMGKIHIECIRDMRMLMMTSRAMLQIMRELFRSLMCEMIGAVEMRLNWNDICAYNTDLNNLTFLICDCTHPKFSPLRERMEACKLEFMHAARESWGLMRSLGLIGLKL